MSAVLVKSARRCCLCFGLNGDFSEKKGQVAHIDHDPANHSERNLAFLCLEHHDTYDSSTSQSKGFTKEEVTFYRGKLFEAVEINLPGRASEKLSNIATELNLVAKFIDATSRNQPFRSTFLNGYEIQRACEDQLLAITPFSPEHVTTSRYQLSCGEEALVNRRLLNFSKERPLKLKRSTSAILTTHEILSLPHWLFGKLEPLAATLRLGLAINGVGTVDPGFRGRLLITVQNRSARPIEIVPGTPLVTIEFAFLNIPPVSW